MEESIYEPLFRSEDTVFTPEQKLWISVVMQAAIDAASTNPATRKEVFNWMRSEDFDIVCGMAGMSKTQVRYDMEAILSAPTIKQAFRYAMSFRYLVRSYIEDNLGEVDKGKDSE